MTKTKYLYISILLLWSCQGGSSRTNSNPPNTPVAKHRGTGRHNDINPYYHNKDPQNQNDNIPECSFYNRLGEDFDRAWILKADKYIEKFLEGGAKLYNYNRLKYSEEDNITQNKKLKWNKYIRSLFCKKWDQSTERILSILSKYKNTPFGPDDDDYNMLDKTGYWSMGWFHTNPYPILPNMKMREFALKQRMVDLIFQYNRDLTPDNLQYAMNMGIDIYEVDEYGYNALYRAAYYGCYKVIPFLESQGLKWDVNLNPMAKKYGNDDCLIIWSYDKTATEVPRIEDEEKFLQIVESVNNGLITEEKEKALIDYMYETRFKCPRIFLRQGVDHSSDPDKIKCPDGMPLIEYCKKCDLTYSGKYRFTTYLIDECNIKKNSESE